ncbi:complex I NDUFA9 subunit family protein [Thalassospira sp. MCCC 1A03138]|uniref:complex I NDUFA9 subunit family protein n=1 Tax=Thalassospira sp. MCCC 1A03138 TaxID=1470576 RepID=UPI000A1F6A4B|nr:complex I NDUFA9 subunit family protein [Thalassospira sp. MCCC 1A03138]OSQ31827.1 3-beta hydroxysteroid dehydrogenase [Thalassospira sp. MCCC 1A03138]
MDRRIVTVFGGTGFVGRHIVKRLLERDFIVRVPTRSFERVKKLKPMGYLGQVVPVHCDVRNEESIKGAIEGSEAVINLLGILYQRGSSSFMNIHVKAAKRIAEEAKACGVKTFLHMSALGVDKNPYALYATSKLAGEKAVRAAFPDAVIFRPSVIFGPEDNFLNQFATMARYSPVLPVIGAPGLPKVELDKGKVDMLGDGGPKFQPVYVADVAEAFVTALVEGKSAGKTYELGGPEVYSFMGLLRDMLQMTRQRAILMPVPFWLASIKAFFLQFLPKPLLTPDQVRLLKTDNVVSDGAEGFAELGITPNSVEAIAPTYLKRFCPPRKSGEFRRFV